MRWRQTLITLVLLAGMVAALWAIGRWRTAAPAGNGLMRSIVAAGNRAPQRLVRSLDFDRNRETLPNAPIEVEWHGTIVIPRTDSFEFRSYAQGKAELILDGKTVLRDNGSSPQGGVATRLALNSGSHTIRIRYVAASQPSFRLLWRVGAGGPENIPASLLFAEPVVQVDPKEATWVPARDRTALSLSLFAILLTIILHYRRKLLTAIRSMQREPVVQKELLVCLGLMVASLLVRLWAGSTCEETLGEAEVLSAARNFIYGIFNADLRPLSWSDATTLPPTSKWIYVWAALSQSPLASGRVISAIIGAANVGLLFYLGRSYFNQRVAVFTAIFATFLPPLIAQGSLVATDSINALCTLLTIWLFLKALERGGNSAHYLMSAVLLGVLCAADLKNLTIVVPLAGAYWATHWRGIVRERAFPLPIFLAVLPVVAAIIFFGSWPAIWSAPEQIVSQLGRRLGSAPLEFIFGRRQEAPAYYYPLYFAAAVPVVFLAFLFLGIVKNFVTRSGVRVVITCWLLAPFLLFAVGPATGGIRNVGVALWPACLLAGLGAQSLSAGLSKILGKPALATPLDLGLAMVLGLYLLFSGYRVHPYYLDYFGELAGGLAQVAKNNTLQVGAWGEGLAEATRFLNQHAEQNATVFVGAEPSALIKLRSDLRAAQTQQADFMILNKGSASKKPGDNYVLIHANGVRKTKWVWIYGRQDNVTE